MAKVLKLQLVADGPGEPDTDDWMLVNTDNVVLFETVDATRSLVITAQLAASDALYFRGPIPTDVGVPMIQLTRAPHSEGTLQVEQPRTIMVNPRFIVSMVQNTAGNRSTLTLASGEEIEVEDAAFEVAVGIDSSFMAEQENPLSR